MRIASLCRLCLLCFCLQVAGGLAGRPSFSHPIAQGSATLHIGTEQILLEMTVPLEQIVIANRGAPADSGIDAQALDRHGDYLLAHLHLTADSVSLTGKAVSAPTTLNQALVYRLTYPLPVERPGVVKIGQNLLREIEFAPGNPWEVSYRLSVYRDGHLVNQALLAYQEILRLSLDAAGFDSRLGWDYTVQGWRHILHGYDHLLFVAGLVLAVGSLRELAIIVLLFTLAHGLTMTLAVLDWWRVSPRLVEPMIAFSIVAVSLQNIVWPRLSHGKPRQAIAFGFGLFHGLGFAGGLLDSLAALSAEQVAWAIAAFSLGVELGHLSVVIPLYYGLALVGSRGVAVPAPSTSQRLGSLLVGIAGLLYCYYSVSAALA
ncbi:HupE/UreJ family protein [Methylomonas sp. UP202]|uniref:HupE/UreJ family protein n=1 Tax=Methylomonas sp. UP202 TaxID=3040943 RepID=UPI0024784248|nr:HupE/UreJ family protein [Methylomonas sp. UP202]WGS87643.1 HupE/UreJ family protein [Methylomonas sp. UP202]